MRKGKRATAAVALFACGVLTVTGCSNESGSAPETESGSTNQQEATAAPEKNKGCPPAEKLESILSADGGTPFSFAGSGPNEDGGWYCKYQPAARNPMGRSFTVYSRKLKSPGAVLPASGPHALPEFGPEAQISTDCEERQGDDRVTVHFARKGEQKNSQEIVFLASGNLIYDCARQLQVMRDLARFFYENPIGID